MDNSTHKLPEYQAFVGKQCKVTDTIVAGVVDKVGTIVDVIGDDRNGYRYKVEFNPPVGALGHIEIFHPHVHSVEIL
jgi:hypothetical protein